MKKIFTLLLICLTLTTAASAKSSSNDKMFKYGAEFGYSHNWLYASSLLTVKISGYDPISYNATSVINTDGFYVGPTYTFCMPGIGGLYLKSSLIYQYNEGKIKADDVKAIIFNPILDQTEINTLDKLHFITHSLELPVRLGYNYTFENGLGINAFAGVSLNFALDWKIVGDDTSKGAHAELHLINGRMSYTENEHTTTKTDESLKSYRIFDLGIGGGVGVTYKWFYLNLSCDWGITNICKHASYKSEYTGISSEYKNNAHNTQLKLGLGAKF